MWKVPVMLVSMADTTAAMIFTRTVWMPTASAASALDRNQVMAQACDLRIAHDTQVTNRTTRTR